MSRTRRGRGKSPGYEYWSARPGTKMATPGRWAKNLTHRAERRANKRATKDDAGQGD